MQRFALLIDRAHQCAATTRGCEQDDDRQQDDDSVSGHHQITLTLVGRAIWAVWLILMIDTPVPTDRFTRARTEKRYT
ncbi:MAG: hypothetical protein CMJ49_04710 [Planctomycetaceae bacterium]|nr:hypothetical protein [Planctomycetaceae bacterium]